jgi:xanthine/CO dehydrogenase XdhC/CoxF family maturation factor
MKSKLSDNSSTSGFSRFAPAVKSTREFNLSTEQLDRLHGPVGLSIGALTPPEIAVSVMAEVIAVKYGKQT